MILSYSNGSRLALAKGTLLIKHSLMEGHRQLSAEQGRLLDLPVPHPVLLPRPKRLGVVWQWCDMGVRCQFQALEKQSQARLDVREGGSWRAAVSPEMEKSRGRSRQEACRSQV